MEKKSPKFWNILVLIFLDEMHFLLPKDNLLDLSLLNGICIVWDKDWEAYVHQIDLEKESSSLSEITNQMIWNKLNSMETSFVSVIHTFQDFVAGQFNSMNNQLQRLSYCIEKLELVREEK